MKLEVLGLGSSIMIYDEFHTCHWEQPRVMTCEAFESPTRNSRLV